MGIYHHSVYYLWIQLFIVAWNIALQLATMGQKSSIKTLSSLFVLGFFNFVIQRGFHR